PDGKTIACAVARIDLGGNSATIVGFDANNGEERPLISRRWFEIESVAWLGDSNTLAVSAAEQELSPAQLWRVRVANEDVQRITNDLNTYYGASVASNGSALVTLQTDLVTNIWTAPGGDENRAAQITSGAGKYDGYYGVSWAPDGRIFYTSIASGAWDI